MITELLRLLREQPYLTVSSIFVIGMVVFITGFAFVSGVVIQLLKEILRKMR